MERYTTKRHRLWYNQYFQERAQQVEEESDGLLHGPAGPPGPMASSALKDSEEQVRPHLVYQSPGMSLTGTTCTHHTLN